VSLFDSNMIIEAGQAGPDALRELIAENDSSTSAICYVEVLGYHRLTEDARASLERFFSTIRVFPLSTEVIEQAIKLRQIRKMSLGDALVAATALVHRLALVTRNTRHFVWIEGLVVIDPSKDVGSAG
jgi:predicted nucleic acid-binding protein